jgi:hypothetical protein
VNLTLITVYTLVQLLPSASTMTPLESYDSLASCSRAKAEISRTNNPPDAAYPSVYACWPHDQVISYRLPDGRVSGVENLPRVIHLVEDRR